MSGDGAAAARRPRGRPRTSGPEDDVRVLAAPLHSPTPRWSTRSIAAETGVSQSAVVRLWRRTYDGTLVPDQVAGRLSEALFRLDAMTVGPDGCRLALDETEPGDGAEVSARSERVWPLRAALAADLVRRPGGASPHAPIAPRTGRLVLGTGAPDARPGFDVLEPRPWQALLPHLVEAVGGTPASHLADLLLRLRAWAAGDPARPFVWHAHEVPAAPPPARRGAASPSQAQRLAASTVQVIHTAIADGRLRAGDRITESFLARETHASRSQVREALRALGAEGLVDLGAGPGAVVPRPTIDDVTETYAARRALGSVLVARAAGPQVDLRPVRTAFDDLRRVAATGDAWKTGEADLAFQGSIGGAVPMRHVPTMFDQLAVQIRIFLAILGVTYAYPIDAVLRDNAALLRALVDHDADRAATLWDAKMRDATAFMVRQLRRR